MNEIIKQNYEQDHLIYKIIETLPPYIILNQNLIKMFKEKNEYFEEKIFTINSLVSIFEYFEALCWEDIQANILIDYKLEMSEESKKSVLEYFEKNKNEKKVINKNNLTTALRRLMSRSISGSRQEIEIKADSQLKLYIGQYELWTQENVESEAFQLEKDEIIKDDILICHCWMLYNILDGDNFLKKEINKNKEERQKQKHEEHDINEKDKNEEFEINTSSNQKDEEKEGNEGNNKEPKDIDESVEENEEEEEEREFYT